MSSAASGDLGSNVFTLSSVPLFLRVGGLAVAAANCQLAIANCQLLIPNSSYVFFSSIKASILFLLSSKLTV
jgi:hypothetical protein